MTIPTADERAGIDWWNSLPEAHREAFAMPLHLAGTDSSPAACWRLHKTTIARLAEMVDTSSAEEAAFRVLSSGERLAVAVVLGRIDWLRQDRWSSLKDAFNVLDIPMQMAVRVVTAERAAR